MKTYHNIEKSAFRRGEYVGFCHGPWRIFRSQMGGLMGWHAMRLVHRQQREGEPFYFQSHTLAGISAYLAKEEQRDPVNF